ncbi:MAG: 16S rRNA (adenine(1518)-N(6)/adenine(1519)-N(6))-dimethyltransferase RsmA [Sphaerochaetaceae bacterium]
MWDFPYDSPKAIQHLLDQRSLALSKKFGQNFLISSSAIDKMVSALSLEEGMSVWEVGPGIGALSSALLKKGVHLRAFEIDWGFCSILQDLAFADEPNFTLIAGDVLKTWEKQYQEEGTPEVVCGNLPYNVGTVFIARILEKQLLSPTMLFTLQKEVAERLGASVGTKNWSTLSILGQSDYEITQLFNLKGGSFYPPPKVDSTVLLFTKREVPLIPPVLRNQFLKVCRDVFAQKRKTVRNNLLRGTVGSVLGKELTLSALAQAKVSESERSENLGFTQLLNLTKSVQELYDLHASTQEPIR